MSVAQELRTTQANLETRTLELSQAKERITALEGTVTAHETTIAQQAGQLAEQQTAIDGHASAIEQLNADHVAATADLTGQVTALTAENGQLKEKLKNPAFALAGATGENPDNAGGGGEGGQDCSLLATYRGLKGAAKTRFYRENKAELQKLGA